MLQNLKNIYHLFVAIIANVIFMFPARKLYVIGVTGTDGKTTTVSLIYHILKTNGEKVAMVTSIGAFVGDSETDIGLHRTTPTSFLLQKTIKKAVSEKQKYLVLEVTSHALDQHRVFGVPFKIGVLTNVTREHLDYHKTYDNYLKTKEKLLKRAEVAVVNIDDSSYALLTESKKQKTDQNWITYGLGETSKISPKQFPSVNEAMGDFNKYNYLAAASACLSVGIPADSIDKALKTFKMPKGRMDIVYRKEFLVIIDFAHTPNAFDNLLKSLKEITRGNLIHVFGSAGERDREKRPYMGEMSSKYSDMVVLTAEDPRSEEVSKIIDDIESGIEKKDAKVLKIEDRREAIRAAIEMAKPGDTVVITGKSHEKSMSYGKEELPWDEYQEVAEALGKL